MHVGIDLEQFVRDPYGSGIQRVLQRLALEWPTDEVRADFVVPLDDQFGLLTPEQAGALLTLPFLPRQPDEDLRQLVRDHLAGLDLLRVKAGDLIAIHDAWLLPEVSYLPAVLERFALFSRCMPTAMIGYDALPMSEPANYRFKPGASAAVSEYFRLLATTDAVVCISDYARDQILARLRRDPAAAITVAHPGGDHLPTRIGAPPEVPRFCRLGTLEARKRPRELLAAFRTAVDRGLRAELEFIGSPSASDEAINADVASAVDEGIGVSWVRGADDEEVVDRVNHASAFLSIGVEGFGIPVLEAIRVGTPVLFDGIQPAGEIMDGRGARRVAAMDHDDLVATLLEYADPDRLAGLRQQLDPAAVPTWADFARGVAQSVVD